MSGVVKGVKKVFKKVVNVVKTALPYIVMAAAVYFTAGVALSAMPATSAFAASMPGFAGGGFAGLGIGAGKVAGTGIFSQAAAGIGLGSLGSGGGLVGGSFAAGTTATQLGAAGISSGAITAGATKAAAAGIGGAAAQAASVGSMVAATTPAGIAAGTAAGAGTVATVAGPPTVAAAGMSLGDKLLLASTGTQALGAFMSPTPKEQAKFQGAFYGMDSKGGGGAIVPTGGMPQPPQQAPQPGPQAPAPEAPEQAQPQPVANTAPTGGQPPADLFAQGGQFQTGTPQRAGSRYDVSQQSPDLFQPMGGVRYI